MGFRAILLCGDPDYYLRQGFIPAETLGIRTEDNMYATALHVCELYDNALANVKGRYIEDKIYQIDKSAANEFDKRFPPKEIVVGTPSQKQFNQIVVMQKKSELRLNNLNRLICTSLELGPAMILSNYHSI